MIGGQRRWRGQDEDPCLTQQFRLFAGNGAREEGFTRARRSDQQDAFRYSTTEFLKFFRITQELDQLLHFILGFLDSGDVAKSDLIFVAGQHACFGFAKVEGAFAGHTDLLAEQEIENEEKERDREKTKNGLGEQVDSARMAG